MARDGYAYAVLADGARPHLHRAGVRALLGTAEETGVRVSFAPAARGRSFRYVREHQGDTAAPSGWDDVLAEVEAEAGAGTGGRGRLGPPAAQLAPDAGLFEARALEEGTTGARASHGSGIVRPGRSNDAAPEAVADSYAHAVLVDGAQPYLHRAGVRALLGVAEETGVRTSFTPAGHGRSFRYVHEDGDSSMAPSGWDDVLAQTEAVGTTEALPGDPEPTGTVAGAGTPVIVDMVVPGGRAGAATAAVERLPEPIADSVPLSVEQAMPHRTEEPAVRRPAKAPAPATRPPVEVPVSESELTESAPERASAEAVRNASTRALRNEPPTVSRSVPMPQPAIVAELVPATELAPMPVAAPDPTLAPDPTPGPGLTPGPTPRHVPRPAPRHAPAAAGPTPTRSRTLTTPRPVAHPGTTGTPHEPDPGDPFTSSRTSPRRHVTPPYRRSSSPPAAAPAPPQQQPTDPDPAPTSAPQAPAAARTPAQPPVVVVRAPVAPQGEAAFWERRHLGRFLNGVLR
ncbi:hypothetical protein ACIQI8_01185 [Streptomyces sp. NPDC092369]|uniref:hypothetical protein n=1 Tax=Streptomyces sp. NPDC092369 TaxID=3366015 RepID=UPI00380B2F7C